MAHRLIYIALLALCQGSANGVLQMTSAGPNNEPTAAAQPSAAEEFLDVHNQARAEVGVGPLKWGESLANATTRLVRYQGVRNRCQFANLSSGGKYGANQLWASGMVVTARMAVEAWVAEKKYYNHTDNSCAANHRCGVYKQVVWRKSSELGCAQATCAKEGSSLTICFYYPPGNVIGESPY
ncbi:hypothetical protein Nepgr_008294 [Nepenthes gracilis]|uniref:SCP domain-containing protein n=1 Tax=Nepenthes gracilis TaxID=150966 RepID=A0AAD3S8L5_NEPGR|nr:hypothetical protein Nepgr_008294 [Nepenthes gracilis]